MAIKTTTVNVNPPAYGAPTYSAKRDLGTLPPVVVNLPPEKKGVTLGTFILGFGALFGAMALANLAGGRRRRA